MTGPRTPAEHSALRILVFNGPFWPHVGGAETFLLQLTTYLHQQGFVIAVATRTPHSGDNPLPFPVYWQPTERQLRQLVDWCDILHLNGMHVGLLLWAFCPTAEATGAATIPIVARD
jgi:hypothetical protein